MIRTVETRDVNSKADRQWVAEVWSSRWGGDVMVTRGRTHRWDDLPAVVAVKDERISGVAVYRVAANGCELVSLDAIDPRQGIGTTLLAAVEDRAARAGSPQGIPWRAGCRATYPPTRWRDAVALGPFSPSRALSGVFP